MIEALLGGLTAGLATIGISEALMRYWSVRPLNAVWTIALTGIALRTVWVLGVLVVVVANGLLAPIPFVAALLLGYLVGQLLEGVRYQRFVESKTC